ncbi:RNA-binding protein KhpA, partial [Dysosmobacter welbionis]
GRPLRRRQRRATPSRNPETPGAAGPERPAPRRCRCGLPPAGSLPGRPGPPGGTPSPGGCGCRTGPARSAPAWGDRPR